MTIPEPEWRDDEFGQPRHALFIGRLFVGGILRSSSPDRLRVLTPWRGWFMSDFEGANTGYFATADEARASVEAALKDAIGCCAKRS